MLDTARRLEAAGWVELGVGRRPPRPLAHRNPGRSAADEMAPEQAAALRAIADLPPGGELLLQGVAASGKTDVVLAAAGGHARGCRGAIVLVPEITGVPRRRPAARGGRAVASRSSIRGSRSGSGTTNGNGWWTVTPAWSSAPARWSSLRSCSLGLLVLDESHDGGYKADRTPRYDTRWVAARRAVLTGARFVQATATRTS